MELAAIPEKAKVLIEEHIRLLETQLPDFLDAYLVYGHSAWVLIPRVSVILISLQAPNGPPRQPMYMHSVKSTMPCKGDIPKPYWMDGMPAQQILQRLKQQTSLACASTMEGFRGWHSLAKTP
jgi:hypothetical protein